MNWNDFGHTETELRGKPVDGSEGEERFKQTLCNLL